MNKKTRALAYAAGALLCFSAAMLVSRLADLGVVPAEEFGAGDWKRGDVKLAVEVVSKDGVTRPLGNDPVLAAGDRLRLSYGKTRYTYLWLVRVHADKRIEPLLPMPKYGRSTENNGEVIDELIELEVGEPVVLMGMFIAIPRRLEEIQAAANEVESDDPETVARELYIPSRRFVHVIRFGEP